MFCSKCGAKIADNAKFCPFCGCPNEFLSNSVDNRTSTQSNQFVETVLKTKTNAKAGVGMNCGLAYTLCIFSALLGVISNFLDYFGDDPIIGSIISLFSAIVTLIIWICATNLLRQKGNTPRRVLALSIITVSTYILLFVLLILSDIFYSNSLDIIIQVILVLYYGIVIWWAVSMLNSFTGKMRIYAIFNLVSILISLAFAFGTSENPEIQLIVYTVFDIADCILLIMALTESDNK